MTTPTPTTPGLADVQDMLTTGLEQIAELEHQVADLDAQLAEDNTTIAELNAALDAKREQVDAQRAIVAPLRVSYQQALSYAKLASKKPHEQQARRDVTACKHPLDAAKKELQRLEQEFSEASDLHTARLVELDKKIHMLEFERSVAQDQIDALRPGVEKVKQELGHLLLAEMQHEYVTKQTTVQQIETQLVEAQAEAQAFLTDAQKRLADWPEHQRAMKRLERPDDAVLRLTDATLLYMKTYLEDARNANALSNAGLVLAPSVRIANTNIANLWGPLFVDFSEMIQVIQHRPFTLQQHYEQVARFRQEHLDSRHHQQQD